MPRSSVMATKSRKPAMAWSQSGEIPSTFSAELMVLSLLFAVRSLLLWYGITCGC